MKVLVCGGREYGNRARVFAVLDDLHAGRGITCLVHGAARGADSLAEEWARSRGIPYRGHPARWKEHAPGWCRCTEAEKARGYCKSEGGRRNQAMLDLEHRPDIGKPIACLVAFPGGTGTADMVRRVRAASIEVREVR